MDLMYLSKLSIITDIKIIMATIKILFMPESTEGIEAGKTTAMNKEAGVRVLALNSEFYAEKISDTFEESIDVCMEALSKQLLKAKEKLQGK